MVILDEKKWRKTIKNNLTINKLTIIIVELPAFILKLETIVIRVIRAIRVRNKTNMNLSSF